VTLAILQSQGIAYSRPIIRRTLAVLQSQGSLQ